MINGKIQWLNNNNNNKKYRQTRNITKQKSVCCKGYTEEYDGQCTPNCANTCINSKCVEPEVCKCFSGFVIDKFERYWLYF